jgi:hypothetical protein
MPIDVLFAAISITDLGKSEAWYERVIGRPADVIPNEHEVMWRIVNAGWMYVVVDAARAGHSMVTMSVPDLQAMIGELAERGIEASPIETVGDAGLKTRIVDPDGNTLSFIEVNQG